MPNNELIPAVEHAELAGRIAKSLMMFPFYPQAGDTDEDHRKCLETSFTREIVKFLNEARADRAASPVVGGDRRKALEQGKLKIETLKALWDVYHPDDKRAAISFSEIEIALCMALAGEPAPTSNNADLDDISYALNFFRIKSVSPFEAKQFKVIERALTTPAEGVKVPDDVAMKRVEELLLKRADCTGKIADDETLCAHCYHNSEWHSGDNYIKKGEDVFYYLCNTEYNEYEALCRPCALERGHERTTYAAIQSALNNTAKE